MDWRWYEKGHSDERAASMLADVGKRLIGDQASRVDTQQRFRRLYDGGDDSGRSPVTEFLLGAMVTDKDKGATLKPISLNVVESIVDTAQARVTKDQARPTVTTKRGDYAQQRKAEAIDSALDGYFRVKGVDELADEAVRDAALGGTGLIKVVPDADHRDVVFERRLADELFAEPTDARRGSPRALIEVSGVSAAVLEDAFGAHAAAISGGQQIDADGRSTASEDVSDHIRVYEGWWISRDGKGRHVLATDGGLLSSEVWPYEAFPFAFCRWKPRSTGMWGRGLAEIVEPIQREIDRTLVSIQDGHKLLGKCLVVLPKGFNDRQLSDDWYDVVYGEGNEKPSFIVPQIVPPEIYSHLWELVSRAYQITGVPVDAASSMVPQGLLGSGRAMIVHHNVVSERLTRPIRSYQNMMVALADLTISAWDYLKDRKAMPELRNFGGKGAGWTDVDYDEVRLERKGFVVRVSPISKLDKDIEGTLSRIEQLAKVGAPLKPSQVARIMETLDLDAEKDGAVVQREFVAKQIDSILVADIESDDWMMPAPDPACEPVSMLEQVRTAYLDATNNGVDSDRLDLLRQFELSIKDSMKAEPTAAPAQPMPAGMPPAMPAQPMPPVPPGM